MRVVVCGVGSQAFSRICPSIAAIGECIRNDWALKPRNPPQTLSVGVVS